MCTGCDRAGNAVTRYMGMNFNSIIKGTFSAIRFPNLVIICISLFLVRYSIVKPILSYSGTGSSVSDTNYWLLIAATLLIAAAGYIINDHYDAGIDAINKPGKNLSGTLFPNRTIITVYIIFNAGAFVISWIFGERQGIKYALPVFLLSAGLLYFYSLSYKKLFLLGNVVIAFLSSLIIGLSIIFDKQALLSDTIKLLVIAYALFAFLISLIREIIKDCEDAEGDKKFGAATLPLVTGLKTARMIAAFLSFLMFGTILYIQVAQLQWQNIILFIYTCLFIQLPLLVLMYRNVTAKTKTNDSWNSRLTKIIMVTGLLSMLVFQITSG